MQWHKEHPEGGAEAFGEAYGKFKSKQAIGKSPTAIALQSFLTEHPEATAEQIQQFNQQGRPPRSASAIAAQKFVQENPDATSDDIAKFAGKFGSIQKADRDFATGKQGQQINSLNVGISHVETLRELVHAVKSGET